MRDKSFIEATKDALDLSMKLDKDVLIFGLGVGNSSNIYGSTKGLKEKYGKKRIFDTPSSESALTAMAAGMSLDGLRPVLIHQRFDFMIYSYMRKIPIVVYYESKGVVKLSNFEENNKKGFYYFIYYSSRTNDLYLTTYKKSLQFTIEDLGDRITIPLKDKSFPDFYSYLFSSF